MPDDRRLTISTASARLSVDEVQQHHFSTVRRGFDPGEVRGMLELIAREMAGAAEREAELRTALADAERRAASPEVDEETLTAVLGQETARVLRAARDAAADMVSRAEEEAARARAEAQEQAEQVVSRAEQHAAERIAQSDAAAADTRRRAQDEATARVEHARAEADAMLVQARTECRSMVQEAQELRARVLSDLAKRRRSLHSQIEQLRAGRERLAQTIQGVRHAVDEIADELLHAEDEARQAAEAVRAMPQPDDVLGEPDADAPDLSGVSAAPGDVTPGDWRAAAGGTVTGPAGAVSAGDAAPGDVVPGDWRVVPGGAATGPVGAAVPSAVVSRAVALPDEGTPAVPAAGGSVADGGSGRGRGRRRTTGAAAGTGAEAAEAGARAGSGIGDLGTGAGPGVATSGSAARRASATTDEAEQPGDDAVGKVGARAGDGEAGGPAGTVADNAAGEQESGSAPGSATDDAVGRPPEGDVDALFARLRAARGAGDPGATEPRDGDAAPSPDDGGRAAPVRGTGAGQGQGQGPGPGKGAGAGAGVGVGVGGVSPAFSMLDDDDGPAVRILQHDAKPRPRRRHPARPVGAAPAGGAPAADMSAAPVDPAVTGAVPGSVADASTEAGRAGRVEAGSADEAGGAVDAPTGTTSDGAPGTTSDGAPGAAADADREPASELDAAAADPELARRDELVRPVIAGLARRLKRALQDDQNDLLDRLRNAGAGRADGTALLPDESEHRARYVIAVREHLDEAARAGTAFCGASAADAPPMAAVADELAGALVSALRRRLDLGNGAADDQQAAERVGAAFREWKGSRVEALATDHIVAAFSQAVVAGTPAGSELRWVVDDDGGACADCDDNALDDGVPAGQEFPTGHRHPPAHAGCRCLLVPVSP